MPAPLLLAALLSLPAAALEPRERARAALKGGRIAEAVDLYRDLAPSSPDAALAAEYAYALARFGSVEPAADQLDRALRIDEADPEARFWAVPVLFGLGIREAALDFTSPPPPWLGRRAALPPRAPPEYPVSAEYELAAGDLRMAQGRPVAALYRYARAVKAAPKESLPLSGAALALEKLGAFQAAASYARRDFEVERAHGVSEDELRVIGEYIKYLKAGPPPGGPAPDPGAREKLAAAALIGAATDQFALAEALDFGLGGPRDGPGALGWYRKAADQGYAAAGARIGQMHELGRGVPVDHAAAAEWYAWAGENSPWALTNLAWLHESGQGVSQSRRKAVELLQKAAALEEPGAVKGLAALERAEALRPGAPYRWALEDAFIPEVWNPYHLPPSSAAVAAPGPPEKLRALILEAPDVSTRAAAVEAWKGLLSTATPRDLLWRRVDETLDLLSTLRGTRGRWGARRYAIISLFPHGLLNLIRDLLLDGTDDPRWLAPWLRMEELRRSLAQDEDPTLAEYFRVVLSTVPPIPGRERRKAEALKLRRRLQAELPEHGRFFEEYWGLLEDLERKQFEEREGRLRRIAASSFTVAGKAALRAWSETEMTGRLRYLWPTFQSRVLLEAWEPFRVAPDRVRREGDDEVHALRVRARGAEHLLRLEPLVRGWPDLSPLYPAGSAQAAAEARMKEALSVVQAALYRAAAAAGGAGPAVEEDDPRRRLAPGPDGPVPLREVPAPPRVKRVAEYSFDPHLSHIILKGKIAGRRAELLLDTGASFCLVGERFAGGLGPPVERVTITASSRPVTLSLFNPPEIRLGRLKVCADAPVGVGDFFSACPNKSIPQDGVLGLPAFKDYVVQLDYSRGKVVFFQAGSASAAWGNAVPMTFFHPRIPRIIGGLPEGTPAVFDLDSAGYSGLGGADFRRAAAAPGVRPWLTGGCDLGGVGVNRTAGFEGVKIAGRTYPRLHFEELGEESRGRLGLDFLKRHLVTFDFPGKRLYLKPEGGWDAPAKDDPVGIVFDGSTRPVVLRVAPGLAAERAGIRPGDEVTAVGGRPLGQVDGLHESLSSATPLATISVLREGRTLELAVEAPPEATPGGSAPPAWGLPVRRIIPPTGIDEDGLAAFLDELRLRPGRPLERADLESDEARIREGYRFHFPQAEIRARVEVDTEAGRVDVDFLDALGPSPQVAVLRLRGARRALRAAANRALGLKPGDSYKERLLQEGLGRLRRFYWEEGYWAVDLGTPTLQVRSDAAVSIEVRVREGERLACGGTRFSGNSIFPDERLRTLLPYAEGKPCRWGGVEWAADAIRRLYTEKARLPRIAVAWTRRPGGRADLEFAIREGPPLRLASVEVAGLRDPARRAEAEKLLLPRPWELFDGPKTWATEARLRELPFVQGVRSRLKSPEDGNHQVRLIFEVVERTGSK